MGGFKVDVEPWGASKARARENKAAVHHYFTEVNPGGSIPDCYRALKLTAGTVKKYVEILAGEGLLKLGSVDLHPRETRQRRNTEAVYRYFTEVNPGGRLSECAEALKLSIKTVKTHVSKIQAEQGDEGHGEV